jgi:formylglycine-generating enzyme required for sulfatase activity
LNDGFVVHAPVDSFSPNPFGLHHVHGNVSEWCLDGWEVSSYSAAGRPNPVWPTGGASSRVRRGGDFSSKAFFARSARRYYNSPDNQDSLLGLRPARGITRQMR